MTEEELNAIEARAKDVYQSESIVSEDVPALVAEVRRLGSVVVKAKQYLEGSPVCYCDRDGECGPCFQLREEMKNAVYEVLP